jgi:hypothetical protein
MHYLPGPGTGEEDRLFRSDYLNEHPMLLEYMTLSAAPGGETGGGAEAAAARASTRPLITST